MHPYDSSFRRTFHLRGRCQSGSWRWLIAMLLLVQGCEDPVRQARIAALGPEAPDVPPGSLHRPNQPCLLCHSPEGPAAPMSAAGTVFRDPAESRPAAGVKVRLIDAGRRSFVAVTNCAGNFFIYSAEYAPTLPLWVSLEWQGLRIDMESPMHKDGDCGSCHQSPKSPTAAGHVFLTDDPSLLDKVSASACEGARP